jgi:hypothetical protein
MKRADSRPELSCRLQNIYGMSTAAMQDALSFAPLNFSTHLSYDIIRSGDEDQFSNIYQFLSRMVSLAIGHPPGQFSC